MPDNLNFKKLIPKTETKIEIHSLVYQQTTMSMPPKSSKFMAQTIRSGHHERETFHKFFECWLVEQKQHLQELISAAQHFQPPPPQHTAANDEEDPNLRSLIDRVVGHYEHYYRAKSSWAKHDVMSMFTPSWLSNLEDTFLWMGGWQPTMAVHLLYSKSGLQLEAKLPDLIRGLHTGDLGDLSLTQLRKVDDLQQRTVKKEKEINEKMAKVQESVADSSMVELSNIVSDMIRNDQDNGWGTAGTLEATNSRVESALEPKKEGLEEILRGADDLRLRTLKEVLGILTPTQAVHFLIAAAELHLRIHDWGKQRDAASAANHSDRNGF